MITRAAVHLYKITSRDTGWEFRELPPGGVGRHVLSDLTWNNVPNQVAIVRAGPVDPLVQLLRTGDAEGKNRAACSDVVRPRGKQPGQQGHHRACGGGGRPAGAAAAQWRRRGEVSSSNGVEQACNESVVNRLAIVQAGAVEPLQVFLVQSVHRYTKLYAAEALKCLQTVSSIRVGEV
eukprot:792751-Prorocentrum_minimum.AAC.2